MRRFIWWIVSNIALITTQMLLGLVRSVASYMVGTVTGLYSGYIGWIRCLFVGMRLANIANKALASRLTIMMITKTVKNSYLTLLYYRWIE